jgi:hypothetical protein
MASFVLAPQQLETPEGSSGAAPSSHLNAGQPLHQRLIIGQSGEFKPTFPLFGKRSRLFNSVVHFDSLIRTLHGLSGGRFDQACHQSSVRSGRLHASQKRDPANGFLKARGDV